MEGLNNKDINEELNELADKIREDAAQMRFPDKMETETLLNKMNVKKRASRYGFIKKAGMAACFLCAITLMAEIGKYQINNYEKRYTEDAPQNTKGEKNQLEYQEIYEKLLACTDDGNRYAEYNEGLIKEDAKNSLDNAKSESSTASKSQNADYYNTNEQTKGVHEGDIVKTDGQYIYTLKSYDNSKYDSIVYITKADEKKLKTVAEIKLKKESKRSNTYDEIYVLNDRLIIIGNSIKQNTNIIGRIVDYFDDSYTVGCTAYGPENCDTIITTYDINDRANPKKLATVKQEGAYNTSRMVGGILYTISNTYMYTITKDKCVPEVNGKLISAEDIIMPSKVESPSYTTLTSIDINNPDEVIASKALVGADPIVYVSENSIYLAIRDYQNNDISDTKEGKKYLKEEERKPQKFEDTDEYKRYTYSYQYDSKKYTAKVFTIVHKSEQKTELIKLDYKNGSIKIVASKTVDGIAEDSLSFDENNGYLRMVANIDTEIYKERYAVFSSRNNSKKHPENIGLDGEMIKEFRYNNFYVLDENLNDVGSLTGLGENENIYAARFLGDIGYFVTYKNTDPVFAVDISNPRNPKLMGELKISGFSDYLHFYKNNLLFGIGMETDEETGSWECLKLEMYDISKGTAKVKDKTLIKDTYYSEAMYNYNSIMIDSDKSIIGFCVDGYKDQKYLIYKYDEKKGFRKISSIALKDYNSARGLYIGEYIYVVSPDTGITVIDMKDYQEVNSFKF